MQILIMIQCEIFCCNYPLLCCNYLCKKKKLYSYHRFLFCVCVCVCAGGDGEEAAVKSIFFVTL